MKIIRYELPQLIPAVHPNNNMTSTGYGPRLRLMFDGDEAKYELWEVKFLGYMRLQKLDGVIDPQGENPADPDVDKNKDSFAELVQFLDDRSLSLVIREAKDDGRKALRILREHYKGKGKPRVISLYTELTSLKKEESESVTDYVIRAETAAVALKHAGEEVSDSLLIAMILKGLPPGFGTFSTVVTQREREMNLTDFKVALRGFEETERSRKMDLQSDSVMKMNSNKVKDNVCYNCSKPGHKAYECRNKKTRWCENCKSNTHDTKFCRRKDRWCINCKSNNHDTSFCRKKDSTKSVQSNESDDHSFTFKIKVDNVNLCELSGGNPESLLVDCGATAHIVHDKSKFEKFDDKFDPKNHCIELADGTRTTGIVKGKGRANDQCSKIRMANNTKLY
jgi:hypothetical protein